MRTSEMSLPTIMRMFLGQINVGRKLGEIESLLDADQQAGELPVIDCHCLQACISHLKYRKASGYDGKYEPSTTS